MDDALAVRGGQATGGLRGQVDDALGAERAALQSLAQALALEQLGDEVGVSVCVADVVDREDVRVIEEPGGSRLLLEAVQAIRVRGVLRGQHLEGNRTPEFRVGRAVHLAHAAGADGGHYFVRAETGAWGKGQRWRDYTRMVETWTCDG